MGLSCVKARHPNLHPSATNDLLDQSPISAHEKVCSPPTESKHALKADEQRLLPSSDSNEICSKRWLGSESDIRIDIQEQPEPCMALNHATESSHVIEGQVTNEGLIDRMAIMRETDSVKVEPVQGIPFCTEDDRSEIAPLGKGVDDLCIVENVQICEQALYNQLFIADDCATLPETQEIKSEQEKVVSAGQETLPMSNRQIVKSIPEILPACDQDLTDGVFDASTNDRESSDHEEQRAEGVAIRINAQPLSQFETALNGLDLDLSESMKMRTLRSGSKKHKKSKNRRKRVRAQQFANSST